MFEGGVSEFYILLKHAKESFHNTSIVLDCDLATIVTHHNQPFFTKVCTRPVAVRFGNLIFLMICLLTRPLFNLFCCMDLRRGL